MVFTAVLIISLTFSEFSGIILSKKISSTFRVVIEVFRVIIVWIIEMILTKFYKEDNISPKNMVWLILMKVVGFSFVILANLIINEIIKLSFCSLDKHHGNVN